jgi:hypothetical protein
MGVTGWWAEILSFSVATSTQKLRAALVGNRADPTGSASIELQQPIAALTGLMPATGVAAPALQEPRFAAEAGTQGNVATELQQPVTALAGSGAQVGTSAIVLQEPIAALSGIQAQSGSMAAAVTKVTTALTGTHTATGVQFIDAAAQAGATLTTMPTHATGDLLLFYTFRDGSVTGPSLPAGWTGVFNQVGTSCSSRSGSRVATSSSESSPTWTNATGVVCLVYRNAQVLGYTGNAGTTSTISYLAHTRTAPSGSWITRFAGHRTATNLLTNTPAGYTARAGVATEVRGMDSGGAVASDPTTQTQSVNAASGWMAYTVEIGPSP